MPCPLAVPCWICGSQESQHVQASQKQDSLLKDTSVLNHLQYWTVSHLVFRVRSFVATSLLDLPLGPPGPITSLGLKQKFSKICPAEKWELPQVSITLPLWATHRPFRLQACLHSRDPAGGSKRTEDQILALVLMSYVSSESLIPSEHDDPGPYL